jgi:hypothetical protein
LHKGIWLPIRWVPLSCGVFLCLHAHSLCRYLFNGFCISGAGSCTDSPRGTDRRRCYSPSIASLMPQFIGVVRRDPLSLSPGASWPLSPPERGLVLSDLGRGGTALLHIHFAGIHSVPMNKVRAPIRWSVCWCRRQGSPFHVGYPCVAVCTPAVVICITALCISGDSFCTALRRGLGWRRCSFPRARSKNAARL